MTQPNDTTPPPRDTLHVLHGITCIDCGRGGRLSYDSRCDACHRAYAYEAYDEYITDHTD